MPRGGMGAGMVDLPGGYFGGRRPGAGRGKADESIGPYPAGWMGGALRGGLGDIGDDADGGGGNGPGPGAAGPGASASGGGDSSGTGADGNATGPGTAGPGIGTSGTGIGASGGVGASIGGDPATASLAGGDPGDVGNPTAVTGPDPGDPDADVAPGPPGDPTGPIGEDPAVNPITWNVRPFSERLHDFARAILNPTTILSLLNPTPLGMFSLATRGMIGMARGDINARAAENAARTGFSSTIGGQPSSVASSIAAADISSAIADSVAAHGGTAAAANSGSPGQTAAPRQFGVTLPVEPPAAPRPATSPAAVAPATQMRSPALSEDLNVRRRSGGLRVGV